MLRKMDVVMSDFKIKLFKAQAIINNSPTSQTGSFAVSFPPPIEKHGPGWGGGRAYSGTELTR